MKFEDAIKVMEEKRPVFHMLGRDITEYKHINSIIIKMESGVPKAMAELQDKKQKNATCTAYLDRIYEKGEKDVTAVN